MNMIGSVSHEQLFVEVASSFNDSEVVWPLLWFILEGPLIVPPRYGIQVLVSGTENSMGMSGYLMLISIIPVRQVSIVIPLHHRHSIVGFILRTHDCLVVVGIEVLNIVDEMSLLILSVALVGLDGG